MKKILFYSALAILAMASCTAEPEIDIAITPDTPAVSGEQVTIHATLGYDDVRTVVQPGGKVFWSPGDKIMVVHGGDTPSGFEITKSCFTSTNTEPAASADFVGIMPAYSTDSWWNYPHFLVLYPYVDDEVNYYTNGRSARFVIPDEQVAVPGSFADNVFFAAAAYIDDLSDIHFQNLLGGIVISVDEPGIEKIVLKATGGESIAGGVGIDISTGHSINFNTGKLTLEETDEYIGDYSYGRINAGPSEITFAPASGTFIPGKDYYIVMRPTTLKQGFSLYVYKSDGRGTKLSINKSVEVRQAEFRTLRDCDASFDWNNTVVTLDKNQVFMDCFSGGFYNKVICPGDYIVQNNNDWITEIYDEDTWTQPFDYSWSRNLAAPENYEIGGDARFDGCYHMFAVKANYGPERTGIITYRHNGQDFNVTVTQAGGDYLPDIPHRHFGYVLHSIVGGVGDMSLIWNSTSEKYMMYYPLYKYGDSDYRNGRLEWCQGAYGQNGDDVFLSGQYLAWNNALNDGGTWGALNGKADIYDWIHTKYPDNYPGPHDAAAGDVMDEMMDDLDEYFRPVTAIGISANSADPQTRTINVTVDVFAAKAGTYTLTGVLVERQIGFVPGGMLAAAWADHGIIGYFDNNYSGQSITFESDNMVKSVTMSVTAPGFSTEPDNWQAGISYGTHGKWEDMWMLFLTGRQYQGQVPYRVARGNWTDWYVDNCRQADFNTLYDLEVPGFESGSVDGSFDPGYDPYNGEEQWTPSNPSNPNQQ